MYVYYTILSYNILSYTILSYPIPYYIAHTLSYTFVCICLYIINIHHNIGVVWPCWNTVRSTTQTYTRTSYSKPNTHTQTHTQIHTQTHTNTHKLNDSQQRTILMFHHTQTHTHTEHWSTKNHSLPAIVWTKIQERLW